MLTHKRNDGDLTWYFGEGISSFQRSTFGPMLARAEMFHTTKRRRGPLTARVKSGGGSGGEPCYEPDVRTLVRFGDVSRRLSKLDDTLVEALALYHGDLGEAWARHPRGRLVSLFPMTRAGKALIGMVREQEGAVPPRPPADLTDEEAEADRTGLSDNDRLRVIVERDFVKGKNLAVRALVIEALRQATELHSRAHVAWDATGSDLHYQGEVQEAA